MSETGMSTGGYIKPENKRLTDVEDNAMIKPPADRSRSESPVFMAGSRLTQEIKDMDMAVARLLDRLEPILGPPVPANPIDPTTGQQPFGSGLANTIHDLAVEVESITNAVHQITQRLEI